MRLLVLDNEAVAALRDPDHRHHRKVLRYVEAHRAVRRVDPVRRTVVPTTVRVEAGWDRTAPAAAIINRLRIWDVDLDGSTANLAARLRAAHRVSPADAHLGAVVQSAGPARVTVITSDPHDMAAVAGNHGATVIGL